MTTNKKILLLITLIFLISVSVYNLIPGQSLPVGITVDKIIVLKSQRQMMVFADNQLIKTYRISLGRNPIGPKEFEGDKRTPEGLYYINDKNLNSTFHKNLSISYPNKSDVENAASQGKKPGGDIKIHGIRNGLGFINKLHRILDWTSGCIAVTNSEIDELFDSTPIGIPIEIKK